MEIYIYKENMWEAKKKRIYILEFYIGEVNIFL